MLGLKLNHVSKRGHRWHHKLILHWLRQTLVAGRYQAITWTKVKLWSLRSSGIHLRAISKNIPQPSIITKMSFKWHRSQWGNVACWHHKTSSILISIGSGNDLAPDKQRVINWTSADSLTFGRLLSRNKCQWILDQHTSIVFNKCIWKWCLQVADILFRTQWVNDLDLHDVCHSQHWNWYILRKNTSTAICLLIMRCRQLITKICRLPRGSIPQFRRR